jgi:hypothetical protein
MENLHAMIDRPIGVLAVFTHVFCVAGVQPPSMRWLRCPRLTQESSAKLWCGAQIDGARTICQVWQAIALHACV